MPETEKMISFQIPLRDNWLIRVLKRDVKKFRISRSALIIAILKAHYFMEDRS